VVNIFLDLLFVKYLGFGIQGAAYATIIAQAISGILSLGYILLRYKEILPSRRDFRLSANELAELIPTGLSMALMSCIVNIGTIILQVGINSLGTTIIAAHTAGRKIFDIMCVFLFTIGTAMTTFVSQNIGAGKPERVRQGVRHAILITTGETLVLILFCFVCSKSILIWLTGSTDSELINAAIMYLRVSCLNFFWLGPLFILRCTMQGMGRKIIPLFSSAIELGMKILSTALLAPMLGYFGIAITEPISWLLCTAMLAVIYLTHKPTAAASE
jgi:Na+-driven multidrug efflux pump